MDQWLRLGDELFVENGQFFRCEIETHSGGPIHEELDFLQHLAELTMQRNEIGIGKNPVTISNSGALNPRRTKHHYRRLFTKENGSVKPTQDFITEASESLGLWLEWTRTNNLYAEGGFPHNTDPAYDVLSIIIDDANVPRLQVVQVKATKRGVHNHTGNAISKFEELEKGYFDSELSCRLELLERNGSSPGVNVADLLFDRERRYRVTLIHGLPTNQFQILSTYDSKIKGTAERRSAYLIRADFDQLWKILGKVVYGQLV